ncbi:MAG TPA: PAS domain S-box protein, partial [Steroidobacteraceae bacterium]|nr:PAS domain S-box protein [Steroidobacteraceae bacterium]
MWQTDAQGAFTHVSPGVTRTLGFTPQEMLGRAAFDGMVLGDAAPLLLLITGAADIRRPFSMLERRVAHRDGHEVIIASSGVPLFAPGGAFRGYYGVDRDVTGQRHAHETAAASEYQLRAILEAAVEGILVADPATRETVLANSALCRLLGYGASEFPGLRFADLLPAEASPQDLLRFDGMLQGEIRAADDIGIRRKDGSLLYVSIAGARLDIGGRTLAVAVFHDVEERRQAREVLSASERRFHTIFDVVTDGIILHELETGAFVEVNRRICELLGYTRTELLALDIGQVSADHSAAAREQSLRRMSLAIAGEPQCFEWQ